MNTRRPSESRLSKEKRFILMLLPYFPRYWKAMVLAFACMILTAATQAGTLSALELVLGRLFPESDSSSGLSADEVMNTGTLGGIQSWFSGLFQAWKSWLENDVIASFAGSHSPYQMLIVLAVVVAVLTLLKGLSEFGGEYLSNWVTQRFLRDFRRDLFAHISRLSLDFFSQKGTGSIMARLVNDVQLLGDSLLLWGYLISEPLVILGLMAYAMGIHIELTLLAIAVFPFAGILMALIGKRIQRARKRAQQRLGEISKRLVESFTSMRVVQSFGAEEHEQRKFADRTQSLFQEAMKITLSRASAGPIMEFLGALGIAAILLMGGYYTLQQGTLDGRQFVVLVFAIGLMYQPVKKISKAYNEFQQGVAAAERVLEVYDIQPTITDRPGAISADDFQHQIEFKRVSFSYDGGTTWALKGISFCAAKGKKIALVGASGAGKSTTADLLARFYDVTEGAIEIDGRDVRDITIRSLRNLIAFVPQEVLLFNDTVGANIAYGRPEASQVEIEQVAKLAFAHEFIAQMPQGYQTIIGERGTALSGGQCQRLAIARALLKQAPILILDEATSALDTESEKVVQLALKNLMENHTTFIIAHRLSTVRDADMILVLSEGRLVGCGTHEELLASNAVYEKLHRLQFIEGGGK